MSLSYFFLMAEFPLCLSTEVPACTLSHFSFILLAQPYPFSVHLPGEVAIVFLLHAHLTSPLAYSLNSEPRFFINVTETDGF